MSKNTGYQCGKCGREPDWNELSNGTCPVCDSLKANQTGSSEPPKTRTESWPVTTDESGFSTRYFELTAEKARLEEKLAKINEEIEAMTVLSWCS